MEGEEVLPVSNQIEYVDIQQAHRDHPDKAQAPSSEELDGIAPGTLVKVAGGVAGGSGERFWVLVTSTSGDRITGKVDSDLTSLPLLYGEEITVERRHVYQVYS
jgi:hypothetical protein